jgi:hypothetical protein
MLNSIADFPESVTIPGRDPAVFCTMDRYLAATCHQKTLKDRKDKA